MNDLSSPKVKRLLIGILVVFGFIFCIQSCFAVMPDIHDVKQTINVNMPILSINTNTIEQDDNGSPSPTPPVKSLKETMAEKVKTALGN